MLGVITLVPSVVAILAAFAGGPLQAQPCQPTLSSQGRPANGLAYIVRREIALTTTVCRHINWMARTHRLPLASPTPDGALTDSDPEYAADLAVAVHEAGHLRHPTWSEGRVHRYAALHVKFFAQRLGFSRPNRLAVAEIARDIR
jgi:hypothetical protein